MAEISNERYEELRGYLELWLERPVTFEEAKEIGVGLVDFYELLLDFSDRQSRPGLLQATHESLDTALQDDSGVHS